MFGRGFVLRVIVHDDKPIGPPVLENRLRFQNAPRRDATNNSGVPAACQDFGFEFERVDHANNLPRKPIMAKLDAAKRKAIPSKEFAGPDRSYPVPDRSHAANAKSRAKQMLDKGHISEAEYNKICAKADKVLGKEM
jgi:hypothetical protein